MRTKVYAFDFDGTLTTKDTLIEFIKFACGKGRLYATLALYLPLLVLMKLRLYPNWKAKQRVFAHLFRGMSEADFNATCAAFAAANASLMRPRGLDEIRKALSQGGKVMIISASIDNWVRPFFTEFADDIIISCTRIEVRDGSITGKFLTKNCYGEEKVKRIKRAFPYRKSYDLIAFGDSRGDSRMFDYADEHHYKPFRDNRLAGLRAKYGSRVGEILRFGIVGVIATALQTGIYLLIVGLMHYTIANTIAYAVSFVFNYIASTRFTFRVKSTAKRGAGFALSHVVNYLLQTVMLSVSVRLGLSERMALIPMFLVCVPVNFLLVRYFLKKR